MRKFTLSFLISLLSLGSFAQISNPDYTSIFITPKIGTTYSDADVSTLFNTGIGLDFGKTFSKFKVVEFDLRLGLLYGTWKGQNFRNSDLANYKSGVYNEIQTNYKDQLGYVVKNFRTNNFQVGLEGVLRFNIVKSRKFFPYILGGIAFQSYRAQGNLLTNDNSVYLYQPTYVPSSRGFYSQLLDHSYETKLASKVALSGNLGIGIGFNIGNGARIGFEHKMIFLNRDDFDGDISNTKTIRKNDIYHFTNVYFQFYIKRRSHSEKPNKQTSPSSVITPSTPNGQNNDGSNSKDSSIISNLPNVNWINPSDNMSTSISPLELEAITSNISDSSQIIITQNNIEIPNFVFNPSTHKITLNANLQKGNNVFSIEVANNNGASKDQVIVNYKGKSPDILIPYVRWTTPNQTISKSTTSTYQFIAKTTNIYNKNKIKITLNNRIINSYSFDIATGTISFVGKLSKGNNTVKIIAQGESLNSSDIKVVQY